MTFIYGFNEDVDRSGLWVALPRLHSSNTIHWLVLGDLNNVSSVEDRIGDKLINLAKCVTYHNCVEACSLIELKWVVQ